MLLKRIISPSKKNRSLKISFLTGKDCRKDREGKRFLFRFHRVTGFDNLDEHFDENFLFQVSADSEAFTLLKSEWGKKHFA